MDFTLSIYIEAFRATFNAKMKDEANLTRMTGYISLTQASQISNDCDSITYTIENQKDDNGTVSALLSRRIQK